MIKQKGKATGKVAVAVILIATISKLFGFGRDIILGIFYGSSATTDIFLSTLSTSDMLYDLISQAVVIGFIPATARILAKNKDGSKDELNKFTNNMLCILEMVGVCFMLIFLLFGPLIVSFLTPGFKGENFDTAVLFLRIVSVSMIFRTIVSITSAYSQSQQSFIPVSVNSIVMDTFIIIFIIISIRMQSYFLAIGVSVALFCQMIYSFVCARRKGFRLKPRVDFHDPELKTMIIVFLPAIISTSANQIGLAVNRAIASGIQEGGITLLNYASKFSYFVENVVVISLAAIAYPTLSAFSANKEMTPFRNKLKETINTVLILMVPVSAAFIIFSHPIIQLVLEHGKYASSVNYTAFLMKFFSAGIVGVAVNTILIRAMYAHKMVKYSTICAVISVAFNIILDYILAYFIGLTGLAIATGLTYIFSGLLSYTVLTKKIGNFGIKSNLTILIKALISAGIMGAVAYGIYYVCKGFGTIPSLGAAGVVGIVLYFGIMYLLRVDEVGILIGGVLKKIKGKK